MLIILISAPIITGNSIFSLSNLNIAKNSNSLGIQSSSSPVLSQLSAVSNPLSEISTLEMRAATLRKDITNLENNLEREMLNGKIQGKSNFVLRIVEYNYNRQINNKLGAITKLNRDISRKYTSLYSRYARDNEKLSQIALIELATITRANFDGKSSTELFIINRDCEGGIIEDGLILKYANAWNANNYELAASEAGRISNQFNCMSIRQSLKFDKAFTDAVSSITQRRFSSNSGAKNMFLAGTFQILITSLDSNIQFNPPSLDFVNQHRINYLNIFSGIPGDKLGRFGLWLQADDGSLEQFNVCDENNCKLGRDLIWSLKAKNLGLGDCSLNHMVKNGALEGIGYACAEKVCENVFDADAVERSNRLRDSVLGSSSGVSAQDLNSRRVVKQQSRNEQSQEGPQTPDVSRSGETQYGVPAGDFDDICSKRRAQGRSAAPQDGQRGPCGIGENALNSRRSGSQPFRCQSGSGSTERAVPDSVTCRAGVAADGGLIVDSPFGGAGVPEAEREVLDRLKDMVTRSVLDNPDVATAYRNTFGLEMDRAARQAVISGVAEGTVRIITPHPAMPVTLVGSSSDSAGIQGLVAHMQSQAIAQLTLQGVGALMVHGFMAANSRVPSTTEARTAYDKFTREVREEENKKRSRPPSGGGGLCLDDSCSCNAQEDKAKSLQGCVGPGRPRSGPGSGGGPIVDPDRSGDNGVGIGSSGSGTLFGLNPSCFGLDRSRGVPRTTCEATRCPDTNQYAAPVKNGNIELCSCTNAGIREGRSGGISTPRGRECPGGVGLCPTGIQQEVQQTQQIDRSNLQIERSSSRQLNFGGLSS